MSQSAWPTRTPGQLAEQSGDDELGHYVIRELRPKALTRCGILDGDHPTGLMIGSSPRHCKSSVYYYRKGSAASTLKCDDIDWDFLAQAKIIHISGITAAISASSRQMVYAVAEFAKQHGILFSFDPNIRRKLWSLEEATEALVPLFSLADIVLLGDEEAQILLQTDEQEQVASALHARGARWVALKQGAEGAYVSDGKTGISIPAEPVKVADTIGAGDAFNAGFAGILEGKTVAECGRMGAVMGALAVASYGDTDGLPDRKDFDAMMNNIQGVYR